MRRFVAWWNRDTVAGRKAMKGPTKWREILIIRPTELPNDRGPVPPTFFPSVDLKSLRSRRSQIPLYREESPHVVNTSLARFVRRWRTTSEAKARAYDSDETIGVATLAAQLKGDVTEFPQAKWHQYEPVNNDNARAGAVMAFGQPGEHNLRLQQSGSHSFADG